MQTLPAKVKRPTLGVVFGVLALLAMCTTAWAQGSARIASDEAAGYVIFPKIVVDTNGVLNGGLAVDTVVQLTNTSDELIRVNCWYLDATGVCSNSPGTFCRITADCPRGGECVPNCSADDFTLTLTPRQPLAWRVSEPPDFLPCFPGQPPPRPPCASSGDPNQLNADADIPLTTDPFLGELKCVQVDDGDAPVDRNDLKGEATIYSVSDQSPAMVDVATYNAIGVQAVSGVNDGDSELVLGQEYAGCPLALVVDHLFDYAPSLNDPDPNTTVVTELTLVPCTENMLGYTPPATPPLTTAQMLVYNEFEQRFSTSRGVRCYGNMLLGDIDTRPGPQDNYTSLFSVGTQGTLSGQTRIRGVQSGTTGHGLLGVAQEIHTKSGRMGSAAFNLNYSGDRSIADVVTLSLPGPPDPNTL